MDLECRWFGPPPSEAPTLIFLHEGLGPRSRPLAPRQRGEGARSAGEGPRQWRRNPLIRLRHLLPRFAGEKDSRFPTETTDLRLCLVRYHGANVDVAFRGWNDVWLHPEFRDWNIEEFLSAIEVLR